MRLGDLRNADSFKKAVCICWIKYMKSVASLGLGLFQRPSILSRFVFHLFFSFWSGPGAILCLFEKCHLNTIDMIDFTLIS